MWRVPPKLEYNASVGSCQSTSKKTCTRELVLKHHFKSQERQSREKDIPARITWRIRAGLFRKMYCPLRWACKWPHIPLKTKCSELHRNATQLSQPSIKKNHLSTDCTMSPVSTPGKQTTKRDSISASCDEPRTASSAPCNEPNPASVNRNNKVMGK